MTRSLRASLLVAFLGAVLVAIVLTIPTVQAQGPLAELLRSTHVHGLAIDRSDPGRLLIATHHGLHALQIDNGTVSPVSERRDDLMGFTPHPTERTVLYASGHPARGGNLGFITSEDGGRTWKTLSPGVRGPVDFHQMDVSKADPRVIFGIYDDLQVSGDAGRTWRRQATAPEGLIDLAASAQNAARLFAATQRGLLVSQDGGQTWQPGHLLRRPATSVETTATGTVFAFMVGSGLIRAEEPSLSWSTVSNDFGDRYLLHLAVDPDDHTRLFAATQRNELMASRDSGRTWHFLAVP